MLANISQEDLETSRALTTDRLRSQFSADLQGRTFLIGIRISMHSSRAWAFSLPYKVLNISSSTYRDIKTNRNTICLVKTEEITWINNTGDTHNLHRYKTPSDNLSIVFKSRTGISVDSSQME